MILLIDNYDSFTFNLYQYLREITDEEVRVERNDRITIEEIRSIEKTSELREELDPVGWPESAGDTSPWLLNYYCLAEGGGDSLD